LLSVVAIANKDGHVLTEWQCAARGGIRNRKNIPLLGCTWRNACMRKLNAPKDNVNSRSRDLPVRG
jgi:hypothetical protein